MTVADTPIQMVRGSTACGNKKFPSFTNSILALMPNQPAIKSLQGISPVINWMGPEADHTPSNSVECKTQWSYTSTPPYAFMTSTEITSTSQQYLTHLNRTHYLNHPLTSMRYNTHPFNHPFTAMRYNSHPFNHPFTAMRHNTHVQSHSIPQYKMRLNIFTA